jgi:NAD(P)-dependent dehydrogenase (short-subunit alcohol dehydrogenase family)
MDRIEGRNAFITGGASGIGLAIAESLVADGAHVVLADWDADALERQAARLGESAHPLYLDVRDRAGWGEVRRTVEATFGPVEILVNNAGVGPGHLELVDLDPDDLAPTHRLRMRVLRAPVSHGFHSIPPPPPDISTDVQDVYAADTTGANGSAEPTGATASATERGHPRPA